MVFSSLTFLFIFLPFFLAIYFVVFLIYKMTKKVALLSCANFLLFFASLIFYFWGQGWFVILMMASAVLDYVCGIIIDYGRHSGRFSDITAHRIAKVGLISSVVGNLTILCVFKYFNFGINTLQNMLSLIGISTSFVHVAQIVLPIGISFYTFQTMSYTIDIYRGVAKVNKNFINYACFVTMFPQLVAGPIVRYKDIAVQFINRSVTVNSFSSGIERFCIGIGKKVLIANKMAIIADKVFSAPVNSLDPATMWLGLIAYTLQIYFDFSGYSDMAIGLGRMLGFKFLENFNYPYISQSIKEFWRRWHISLSTWFRDYLYIPLGGNRLGKMRTYLNLSFVFFLVGLWHGAAGKFVVWGLYHGLFLIFERGKLGKILAILWFPLRSFYVLCVVMIGWVLFRADSLSHAYSLLKIMLRFGDIPKAMFILDPVYFNNEAFFIMVLGIMGTMPIGRKIKANYLNFIGNDGISNIFLNAEKVVFSLSSVLYLLFLLVVSTIFLASGTYNPFIYFRF